MLRRSLAAVLGLCWLSACQQPLAPVGASPTGAPVLDGRVDMPGYALQATSADVLGQALVTLVNAQGGTVAAGTTDAAGHFTLYRSTLPFAPQEGDGFVLNVSKRLDSAGTPVVTLRSEVMYQNAAWNSISGAAITVNLLTSAITKLDEQDDRLGFGDVMNKVQDGAGISLGGFYAFADVDEARQHLQAALAAGRDPAGAWIYPNDVLIHSQADIDRYARYDGIAGNLAFASDFPLSTIALPHLRSVGGSLYIEGNAHLTNLDGLNALAEVGGALTVGDCSQLTSISGLGQLRRVGYGIEIYDNGALTSLAGLDRLESAESLWVSNNTALTDAAHLGALRELEENFTFEGNTHLATLGSLAQLRRVGGGLRIADAGGLVSLGDFTNLATIGGDLSIEDNILLTSLPATPALTHLEGELRIVGNSSLVVDCDALFERVGNKLTASGNASDDCSL